MTYKFEKLVRPDLSQGNRTINEHVATEEVASYSNKPYCPNKAKGFLSSSFKYFPVVSLLIASVEPT